MSERFTRGDEVAMGAGIVGAVSDMHEQHLEAIAPERRTLLVCQCGVVSVDFASARCHRDMRTNISRSCPARWETWQRVDEVGA